MKKIQFSSMILISLILGLLTVFTVSANALEISIHFGSLPPPPPPPLRYTAPPEPVYVTFHSDVVLYLGSSYFSLGYPDVYVYHRDYGLTPDEVIYVLYLSHYTRRSPVYIINIYRDRRDWSIVVRDLRLPREAPRWLSYRDAPTVAVLHATSAYYGVSYTQIQQIHQKGYRPAEIVAAVNISSKSGRPVSNILIERNKGKSWENIAKENKTSLDNIKAPPVKGKSVKFAAPLKEEGTKVRGFEKNDKEFKGEGNAYGRKEFKGQQKGLDKEKQDKEKGKELKSEGKDKDKEKDEDKGKNK